MALHMAHQCNKNSMFAHTRRDVEADERENDTGFEHIGSTESFPVRGPFIQLTMPYFTC